MATNAASLHLLDLPDDLLLEILAVLPGLSVVLRCRQVCRKIYFLSREQHLWIRLFNRSKYMLRQPIELERLGTSDFEKFICRAEMMESIWSDEDTLGTAPRFWRKDLGSRSRHGPPVAIMGDYAVCLQIDSSSWRWRQRLTWVPASDWNGPIVYQFDAELDYPHTARYMDFDTGIFYLVFPSDTSLEIAGFQVDPRVGQPGEVIRFALPTGCRGICPLEPENWFLCSFDGDHFENGLKTEVDVVDLRKSTLFQLVLPHLATLFPEDREFLTQGPRIIATETHLMYASAAGKTAFAVFRRPVSDQGIQLLGNDIALPARAVTHLNPILIGRFPFYFQRLLVMPRSATSFMVVGIRQTRLPGSNESVVILHTFSFNVAEEKTSFEEVGSLTVPGLLDKCFLQSPPSTTRYALGILAVSLILGGGQSVKQENFALRIDFPNLEQDPGPGNRCRMAVTRIQLAPAVDEEWETAEFRCFDHFSGRAALFVSGDTPVGVVFDYLSGEHPELY